MSIQQSWDYIKQVANHASNEKIYNLDDQALKDYFVHIFSKQIIKILTTQDNANFLDIISIFLSRNNVDKLQIVFEIVEKLNIDFVAGSLLFWYVLTLETSNNEIIDFLLEKYLEKHISWEPEKLFNGCILFQVAPTRYFLDRCTILGIDLPLLKICDCNNDTFLNTYAYKIKTPELISRIKFWIQSQHMYQFRIEMNYYWLNMLVARDDYNTIHEIFHFIQEHGDPKEIPELIFHGINLINKEDFIKLTKLMREMGVKSFVNLDYPTDDLDEYSIENIIGLNKIKFDQKGTRLII